MAQTTVAREEVMWAWFSGRAAQSAVTRRRRMYRTKLVKTLGSIRVCWLLKYYVFCTYRQVPENNVTGNSSRSGFEIAIASSFRQRSYITASIIFSSILSFTRSSSPFATLAENSIAMYRLFQSTPSPVPRTPCSVVFIARSMRV